MGHNRRESFHKMLIKSILYHISNQIASLENSFLLQISMPLRYFENFENQKNVKLKCHVSHQDPSSTLHYYTVYILFSWNSQIYFVTIVTSAYCDITATIEQKKWVYFLQTQQKCESILKVDTLFWRLKQSREMWQQ